MKRIKNQNNKRFVAHFDILGFKYLTKNKFDEAWGALSDYRAVMDKLTNDTIVLDTETKESLHKRIKLFLFSDSILIFSLGCEASDLKAMLVVATELFKQSMETCVPLRGGIALGDFAFNYKTAHILDNKDPDYGKMIYELGMCCGPAFVKAYEIGEYAQWMGIVVCNAVKELIKTMNL